ncbi:hypothetical protein E5288_WYG017750 [Bos mutus]|uniref:Melanoma antigen preferentially expressed in tumors-like n=1 Tax=Bos mutus TaxID=72004 RepID=A0A6B0REB8_9CETA|nr:hypothetical protein [Bos mutus]
MSVQNPLRLMNLAGKSLLANEALAISALEYLPIELFPQLFMEAFFGRHRKTLKALVQAWPFVRLPLGGLMQTPHLGTLQTVLDGLNVLLAQKDQPRRCKLQVLDLRNSGQDFWRMWSGSKIHVSSSSSMAPGAVDSLRAEKPLAPFEKLSILSFPMENIMKVLSMVRLDCIEEVHVNCTWYLPTLAMFAPLLGQISKVQRLLISHIHLPAPKEQDKQHVVKITSQFLRLHHLRDLHLESPFYLEGCLDQMLRCLMTPLDTLTITCCLLTDSDLTHLSQSPKVSQLKGLNLSGVMMTYSSPELLPALLEKVSATLQKLYLEQCGIRDSHLEFLLPALSLCIHLTSFSLRGNFLSMAMMEKMLRHTSGLPSLSGELYTAPQESFSSQGILQPSRLAQCRIELLEILKDLGRPRTIWICFTPCPHCGDNTFCQPEPIIYSNNTLT